MNHRGDGETRVVTFGEAKVDTFDELVSRAAEKFALDVAEETQAFLKRYANVDSFSREAKRTKARKGSHVELHLYVSTEYVSSNAWVQFKPFKGEIAALVESNRQGDVKKDREEWGATATVGMIAETLAGLMLVQD